MSDSPQIGILRRKTRPPQVRRDRDSAGDVWRRVLPRVAAEVMGLELVVAGFEERVIDLHQDLSVEEGALLLLLADDHAAPAGLAVVDPGLLACLIEVQTTGRLLSARREARRPTAVDAALTRHAIDGWLAGVAEVRGEGRWPVTGASLPDLRAALLKLEEGSWLENRIDLDLGGGKRSGRMRLFRPVQAATASLPAEPEGLQAVLLPVETALEAVLCRVRVPLGTVVSLAPGQLVALPGVSLRRIRLEAPVGRLVAQVHLGQSRGFRAVRILPTKAADGPPGACEVRRPEQDMEVQDLLPRLSRDGETDAGASLPLPDG